MTRLRSLVAILFMGVMVTPHLPKADERQCGESSLLGAQTLPPGLDRENAELRGVPRTALMRFMGRIGTESLAPAAPAINIDRSLYVRDVSLLNAFSFADVMDTLAGSLGGDAPSGVALFQDWWRTAAPPDPNHAPDIGCTPTLINGFAYTCPADKPRAEASLANITDLRTGRNGEPPFSIIGLVNRGDLVFGKQNPDTCGEYRILAASDTIKKPVDKVDIGKFYISFEAALPNQGNGMCLAVQRFWKSLADESDDEMRRQLRAFFLEQVGMTKDGVLSFPPAPEADFHFGPVMSAANLGLLPDDAQALGLTREKPVGQIRTNSRDATDTWLLRQYSFRKTSLGLRIMPTSLSATPPASIMVPGSGCSEAGTDCNTELGQKIAANTPGLKTTEVGKLSFDLGDICLEAGQMVANSFAGDGYNAAIWKNTAGNGVFAALQAIAARPGLPDIDTKVGFNLEMTSCAGCHRQSAPSHLRHLVANPGNRPLSDFFKQPNDFTHSRLDCEDAACSRYDISLLLKEAFLPWRAFLMEETLNQN